MSFKVALILGVCLLASLQLGNGERARYDNYRVYKVNASDELKLGFLSEMEGASDSLLFLDEVRSVGQSVHIIVAPHKVPDFLEILRINEILYELVEKNWQSVLDSGDSQVVTRADNYGWTSYYQLDDTYRWLQSLTYDFPSIATLIEGGKTYQGRSILGLKISFSKGLVQKPGIFLEAGIHAREWIAPATATYIINQLLTSNDTSIREIAENYDWYIIPHANPDGYVYTHTTDRSWRKTRTPYGTCFGADPNRNWAFRWNEVGASSNPCVDTYAGPSAFSEIEVRSLANYIATLKGKIQLYISFHSYSQYLLYPYGATPDLPENIEDYKKVFNVATAAVNKRYGTKYTGGNIYDAIYPAAGSSVDWAYANVDAKMSFCYELRPGPNSYLTGFRLPAEQIIPTGEETLDSITALIGEVDRLGYFNTV